MEGNGHSTTAPPGDGAEETSPPRAPAAPKSYFHDLGDHLMERGQAEEAVEVYEKATEQDDPRLHLSLGRAYLALHRYRAASESLQQACRLDPHNAQAQMSLAQALVGCKQYEAGMRIYQSLTRHSDPGLALSAHMGLATAHAVQKQYMEAIAILESLIRKHPGHALLYVTEGEIYLRMNDPHSALAMFEKALAIAPGHQEAAQGVYRARETLRRRDRGLDLGPYSWLDVLLTDYPRWWI